jgi:uncharacterized protein with HEPN domain
MTQHEDEVRLRHMVDHGREAVGMLEGRTRQDLERDRQLNLAIVRLLEIVGEAASRTSADTRSSLPQIPWPEIVGLRNRVIHGYDSVDLDIVWETVTSDLPPLIEAIESYLGKGTSA